MLLFGGYFRYRIRYFILILSTLCLTSTISNMVTYNFTKICIDNSTSSENSTSSISKEYSTTQESMLQSAVAVGALVVQIPTSYAFTRLSARTVFFVAGIISTVATGLIPLANQLGFGFFLVARVFQGFAFASTFPVTGMIMSDWAPISEHGLFLALLTGCTQLSNMFTMPVSGMLCSSSFGWPAVYYVHAGVSLILFVLWMIFFRDTPQVPTVTKEEILTIAEGKHEATSKNASGRLIIPYRAILLTPAIWACWIAAWGDLMCVQLVTMFNPTFMKDVLHFTIENTGFLAALPIIVQFVVKVLSGVTSDAITWIGETTKLRIYNSLALGASAIFFVILGFIPADYRTWAIVTMVIGVALIGCNTAGFNKCSTLISRQYSCFVIGHIMTIWSITILIEPFFVNAILHGENGAGVWRAVFLAHAGILMVTNLIFCLFCRSEPAWWTYDKAYEGNEIKLSDNLP